MKFENSWKVVAAAVVCVFLQAGCVKKAASVSTVTQSTTTTTSTNNNPNDPPGTTDTPTNPMVGSAALKNFSEYDNALSLACGNPPVTNVTVSVTVNGTTTSTTSSATTYFAQASAVLPQTSSPGTLNDAVVQTYLKHASYRMNDCIAADGKKADGSRLVLNGVDLTKPNLFTQAQAETVGSTMITVFLHRAMTADDKQNIDDLYTAFGTPVVAQDLTNILVALATGVASSLEFAGMN